MSTGHNLVDFSQGDRGRVREGGTSGAHHQPGLDWVVSLAEVNEMTTVSHEALLVGAADQYRLGELLMPHVLARLLHFSKIRCGGLVNADLTACGGHAARNYGESVLELSGPRLKLVHFGGADLALDLVEGYRHAIAGEEAERFDCLSRISGKDELAAYVRRRTGQMGDFAYLVEPIGEFWGVGTSFHAVGLPNPEALDAETKRAMLAALRKADFVGVRDEAGASFLEREGIAVERMPCALTVLPQVCARQLRECRDRDSLESLRHRFPNGWIAVEVGEVSPQDRERLAEALRAIGDRENLGLVFFSAKRKPSEDTARDLRRWVEAFPEWEAAEFPTDNIWEVASFLLHSRLYCGSSLEARILCMSGGVARINVPSPSAGTGAYCELWEHDDVPVELAPDEDWAADLEEALAVDLSVLQEHSAWLHGRYRESFDRFCAATGLSPRLVPGDEGTEHARLAASVHHLHDEWLGEKRSAALFRRINRPRRARATSLGGKAPSATEKNAL